MTQASRAAILDAIGKELEAPILAFVTGDRPDLQTQIAIDQLVRFPRHLRHIGKRDRIGLVLYTRGGETHAAWPIVNMLREHCEELVVLVPFFAHSCGTLITLGANRVLMSRFATLSPIDPTVANAFNPPDPVNPQARLPMAVEDVLAYFELAEDHGCKSEEASSRAFLRLAETVHPLALGNVQRSLNQIRQLASKMIDLHAPDDEETKKHLIHRLTTALYSHFHLIGRDEAQDIGLPIEDPGDVIDDLLLAYYDECCTDLQLLEKFDPPGMLKAAQNAAGAVAPVPAAGAPAPGVVVPGAPGQAPAAMPGGIPPVAGMPAVQPMAVGVNLERALLETVGTCDAYMTRGTISVQNVPMIPAGVQLPPGFQMQPAQQGVAFEVTFEGWEAVV